MFEPPQVKESGSSKTLWIGLAVVALAVVAVVVFMVGRNDGAANVANSPAASAPAAKADAIHDLKIQRAVMDKDSTGTTAVWAISIENKSPAYSYSNIEYETSYIGPDDKVIVANKGTIPLTLGPQEQKNTQLRDVTYPSGTASYRIRVTSANAEAQ
jgi:hypothetical protein